MKRARKHSLANNGRAKRSSWPAYRRVCEENRRLREEIELERREWAEDQARLLAAQQNLEASRERYVGLYDSAPVGYATLNLAGCVVELNLTAAQLLGRDRQHLLKRPLLPLVDAADRRKFLNYLTKLRMRPATLSAELHFRNGDNGRHLLRLISQSSRDIRTANGAIRVALSDVTERERAKSALRESEGRFRLMADSAPVLVWLAGPDGSCTYFNRTWLQFTGRTLEEELGSGWREVLHPEDREEFLIRYLIAFRARQEFKVECRLRRHDGEYRWVLVHGVPRFEADKRFDGLLGSCIDITERRQAHEELESRVRDRTAELSQANAALKAEMAERQQAEIARTLLAAIVDSSYDAIVGEDLEGRITSWNRAAEKILGYTAAEIIGRPFKVLVPQDRRDEYRRVRAKTRRGGVIEPFETVRLRKAGGQIQVAMTVSPVRNAAGEVVGTSTIARDISRRKELETEVVKISEREQQRIARDLHEGLSQHLAGISCMTNTLKEKLMARGAAETTDAARISHLLDVTVAQSRDLAHGLQPVPPEPNGLMSVLDGLAARVTELFKVGCSFDCPQPVLIDDNAMATHLYRIAQEAVTNAIRHGRARRIDIELSSTPGQLTLAVRNDGVRFVQKRRRRRGMGLGIMNYRAGQIGGTLVVQPGEHHATEVLCTVPIRAVRRLRE